MLGPAEIFTIFFITLGPLKILGPFAQRTHGLDDATVRQIAVRAFLIATISAIAGGFLGAALLASWRISIGAMVITAGLVFLLVGLRQTLEQYEPPHAPDANIPALPASPTAAALRLLFPIVLTPFGIAAVIVLLALSTESGRTGIIVGMVVVVMLLNLTAMLFARSILVGATIVILQILGAVLGILQVGLAIQIIVRGLRDLKVISA
ncbi:MAG TPA: MarC family protein [Candidatus Methylomirabilis sp.]|nr:MarC family protein [Candidatus Methylomirabilis sp.]